MKDTTPHPKYGPCDAFGPDKSCSECTGLIQRTDGTVVDGRGDIVSALVNHYRVSQPAIMFVTGQSNNPQEVVDAFAQMKQALETIKSPALNIAWVGDTATTLLVSEESKK